MERHDAGSRRPERTRFPVGARMAFRGLAACAVVGIASTLLASWRAAGADAGVTAAIWLVPLSGLTSLAGIWTGTFAILEPPALSAADRRLGRAVLAALTVTGPAVLLLAGRA